MLSSKRFYLFASSAQERCLRDLVIIQDTTIRLRGKILTRIGAQNRDRVKLMSTRRTAMESNRDSRCARHISHQFNGGSTNAHRGATILRVPPHSLTSLDGEVKQFQNEKERLLCQLSFWKDQPKALFLSESSERLRASSIKSKEGRARGGGQGRTATANEIAGFPKLTSSHDAKERSGNAGSSF